MGKSGSDDKPLAPMICMRCYGFGRVSDTPNQEPLQYWRMLPAATKERQDVIDVQGMDCPDCDGTGLYGEP